MMMARLDRSIEIASWADWNNSTRIQPGMAAIIMALDVTEIDGRADRRVLVERPRVAPERGIIPTL
jgi:hypothetical protein